MLNLGSINIHCPIKKVKVNTIGMRSLLFFNNSLKEKKQLIFQKLDLQH